MIETSLVRILVENFLSMSRLIIVSSSVKILNDGMRIYLEIYLSKIISCKNFKRWNENLFGNLSSKNRSIIESSSVKISNG